MELKLANLGLRYGALFSIVSVWLCTIFWAVGTGLDEFNAGITWVDVRDIVAFSFTILLPFSIAVGGFSGLLSTVIGFLILEPKHDYHLAPAVGVMLGLILGLVMPLSIYLVMAPDMGSDLPYLLLISTFCGVLAGYLTGRKVNKKFQSYR